MTDKQLPPAWAIARATDEFISSLPLWFHVQINNRARKLSAQQPVPRDEELPGMWERADLIGGATDCEPQQPDAARGECICDDAMRISCPVCNPKQPARDGTCSRRCAETGQCDNNCAPQQADGEAVGEVVGVRGGAKDLIITWSGNSPSIGTKLYLRPSRGVEVTEAVIEHAQSIYDSTGEMAAVLQYALSGVQR